MSASRNNNADRPDCDRLLTHATKSPDATGRIALNFGPINLPGGERRLNVAVTRARERLIVFGSLKADQLDLSRTGATGVRHLKRFLAFAEHGARSFATATDGSIGDHESPFETEVAERLRRLGWTTHPQMGRGRSRPRRRAGAGWRAPSPAGRPCGPSPGRRAGRCS